MHNRVGTLFNTVELERINSSNRLHPERVGELVGYMANRRDKIIWSLFLGNIPGTNNCRIITALNEDTVDVNNDTKLIIKVKPKQRVKKYIGNGYQVDQTFDVRKSNLAENDLLEQYTFP